MPTYDYHCEACGHELELFQSMTEAPRRKCPACGKLKLRRRIGAGAGVLFKGSGFYQTDYRSDSYKQAAKGDAAPKADAPAKAESSAKAEAPARPAKADKPAAKKRPPK